MKMNNIENYIFYFNTFTNHVIIYTADFDTMCFDEVYPSQLLDWNLTPY